MQFLSQEEPVELSDFLLAVVYFDILGFFQILCELVFIEEGVVPLVVTVCGW